MLAQAVLTPAESKRLIAKAVVSLPEVRRALKKGIIIVGLGTTNAHVVEELLGKPIDRGRYVAGMITPRGACVLPRERRLKSLILINGKPTDRPLDDVIKELKDTDVVIKGANAFDAHGNAGVLLASRSGGTVGKVLGYVQARGTNLIIPVGFEKFVPGSLTELVGRTGIFKSAAATGCPVGIAIIHGKIVTEIEAVRILTGAEARVLGKGGVSGAEGSTLLLVSGTRRQIDRFMQIVGRIKGMVDPKIEISCAECAHPDCFYRAHPS
jgi:hypothetical protein